MTLIFELDGHENKALDKITVSQLLDTLNNKDKETIIMWINGSTLEEIAKHISIKYDNRSVDNPLSAMAMGSRIKKILKKLRKTIEKNN